MNGGTEIVTPFSSVAGLFEFEAVAPFRGGSVRVTVKFHRGGQSDADRRAVVKLDLDIQIWHQPLCRIAEFVLGQRDLLVVFRVHKMVMRAVRIKIIHLMLFERDLFERVVRAKAELERIAGQQISAAEPAPSPANCPAYDDETPSLEQANPRAQ